MWLAGEGSNLQPPGPKPGILPIELPANYPLEYRRLLLGGREMQIRRLVCRRLWDL